MLHTEFHGNRFSRSPAMPAQTERHTHTERQKRTSKMWFSFSANLIIHVGLIYLKKNLKLQDFFALQIYIAYTLSKNKSVLHIEFHGNRFSHSPVMPAQTGRQTEKKKKIEKMWFSFSVQLIVGLCVDIIYLEKSKITRNFWLTVLYI